MKRWALAAVWLGSLLCVSGPALPATIEAWGYNSVGQATPPPGNDYVAVDGGLDVSVALKSDGSLACWGNSYYLPHVPTGNDFVAVSAKHQSCTALKSDGSVVAWTTSGPLAVPPITDFTAIAAGSSFTLGLRSDGSLYAWGSNTWGQCNVPGGNNYVAVAAGANHGLALRSNGTAVAWGWSSKGQCAVPGYSDYVALAGGHEFSLGLRAGGSIVAWGSNWEGERNPPGGTGYQAIDAGFHYGMALAGDGSIATWGSNVWGEQNHPAGDDFVAVACGWKHGLALRFNPGSLVCGTGTVTADRDGFTAGGHTLAGLGGAVPLPFTVDVTDLVLDGGMATLVIDYEPAEVAALGIDEATLRAYWWDAGGPQWLLAGKHSNNDQSTGQFVAGAPTGVLGDWGVDVGGDYVWANIDHASTYGLAGIPEPASAAVLLVGWVVLLRRKGRDG